MYLGCVSGKIGNQRIPEQDRMMWGEQKSKEEGCLTWWLTEMGTVPCGCRSCSSLVEIWHHRENNNLLVVTPTMKAWDLYNSGFRHCFKHFVCINLPDPPNNPVRWFPLPYPLSNQGKWPEWAATCLGGMLPVWCGWGCFSYHSLHCLALLEQHAVYQAILQGASH